MKLQKTRSLKILSCFLLLLLSAAIAFSVVGCDDANVLGEGSAGFVFKVVTASGETKTFTVKTDKDTVGEALIDEGLIAGEDGPYGLYVKTVDGETLDYDTDGKYWAFYVDGSYAATGVDVTKIEAGKEYCFKAEKG